MKNYYRNLCLRFLSDQHGSVLVFFALAALILIIAAGVAIDLSRGQTLQTRMQAALDTGGFSGGNKAIAELKQDQASFQTYGSPSNPGNATVNGPLTADVNAEADKYFHVHLPTGSWATGASPSSAGFSADGTTITLHSNTQQNTNVVQAAGGPSNMAVSADSTIRIPPACGTYQDRQCLTGNYNNDDSSPSPINTPGTTHTWTCASSDCTIISPQCSHIDPSCRNTPNPSEVSPDYKCNPDSPSQDYTGAAYGVPGDHTWTCISAVGLAAPQFFNSTATHACHHQDPGILHTPPDHIPPYCDYGIVNPSSQTPDGTRGTPYARCDVTYTWQCYTDMHSPAYTFIARAGTYGDAVRDCNGDCEGTAVTDCRGVCTGGQTGVDAWHRDTCGTCRSPADTGCTDNCYCGYCGNTDEYINGCAYCSYPNYCYTHTIPYHFTGTTCGSCP